MRTISSLRAAIERGHPTRSRSCSRCAVRTLLRGWLCALRAPAWMMPAMDEQPSEKPRSRGIYLLPNLFTTACLFGGFYAVLAAMNGHFEKAAVAIFVAMVMDGLDGRVARLTNTQTAFGAEYDSLSDMVAFGLAPSLVMYEWALLNLGKFGWLAAFVYTTAAALRLARFNTQVG